MSSSPPDVPPRAAPAEWHLFEQLLPSQPLNDLDPRAAQAAYTPWVVTGLLVFPRLHGQATLNEAVAEFVLRFPAPLLPDGKRAREHTLSANTGAYSAAEAEAEFERLLTAAGQRKLPRRAKGRTYPREVIPRRRKSPQRKSPKRPAAP